MFVVKTYKGRELSIVIEDKEEAAEFANETNMPCRVHDAVTNEVVYDVAQNEFSAFYRTIV